MNDYVVDTHSLFWFLTASPRLGANAKAAFDEAQNGLAFIHISAIVLAELYYLNSKYSSPSTSLQSFNGSKPARSMF